MNCEALPIEFELKEMEKNTISEIEKSLLKDTPVITNEFLRWQVLENWWNRNNYTFKGLALEVFDKKNKFKIYGDSELKKYLNLEMGGEYIYQNGKIACTQVKVKKRCSSPKNIYCFFAFCESSRDDLKPSSCHSRSNYHYVDYITPEKPCAHQITSSNLPTLRNKLTEIVESIHQYIKVESIDQNKKTAKIKINGKPAFLDIKDCYGQPDRCIISNYRFSQNELDWIKKKKIVTNRQDDILNYFIQKLLPCVERKDRKCVASFFIKRSDDEDAKQKTGAVTRILLLMTSWKN